MKALFLLAWIPFLLLTSCGPKPMKGEGHLGLAWWSPFEKYKDLYKSYRFTESNRLGFLQENLFADAQEKALDQKIAAITDGFLAMEWICADLGQITSNPLNQELWRNFLSGKVKNVYSKETNSIFCYYLDRLVAVGRNIEPTDGLSMEDACSKEKASLESSYRLDDRSHFKGTNGIATCRLDIQIHTMSPDSCVILSWNSVTDDPSSLSRESCTILYISVYGLGGLMNDFAKIKAPDLEVENNISTDVRIGGGNHPPPKEEKE